MLHNCTLQMRKVVQIGDRVIYTELNSTREYLATIIKINGITNKLPIIKFDDMPYPQGQPTMYINFIESLSKLPKTFCQLP